MVSWSPSCNISEVIDHSSSYLEKANLQIFYPSTNNTKQISTSFMWGKLMEETLVAWFFFSRHTKSNVLVLFPHTKITRSIVFTCVWVIHEVAGPQKASHNHISLQRDCMYAPCTYHSCCFCCWTFFHRNILVHVHIAKFLCRIHGLRLRNHTTHKGFRLRNHVSMI